MSQRPPSTDAVRDGIGLVVSDDFSDPELRGRLYIWGRRRFDRWRHEYARKLMERAWAQGYEAGATDMYAQENGAFVREECETPNPWRKEP
jgi:hypothetical protein